jgi:hypothetical protein
MAVRNTSHPDTTELKSETVLTVVAESRYGKKRNLLQHRLPCSTRYMFVFAGLAVLLCASSRTPHDTTVLIESAKCHFGMHV